MTRRKITPNFRFKDFDDEWEYTKLIDKIASLKSGLSRELSVKDIGLPVVRANNINNGKLNLENDIKFWYEIDPKGAKTENYFIHQDDILINFINSEAKMGTAAYVTEEPKRHTIYTTNILKMNMTKDIVPYFAFLLTFKSHYRYFIKSITKPAVNQASFTTVDFKKYKFYSPSLPEQSAIGSLFQTLDELVSAYKDNLANYQAFKASMLSKMFPKAGQTTPEIRLAGFDREWKTDKLKNRMNISAGGDIDKSRIKTIDKYPVVANALTNKGIVGYYDDYKVKAPAVTVTGRGDVGHAIARHTSFTPIVRLLSLQSNDFDVDFLENMINSIRIYNESTGVPQLTAPQLGNYYIQFPSLDEQRVLGTFFSKLDNLTSSIQSKIEELETLKKKLLQEMFV